MNDLIKFRPSKLFLTHDASGLKGTTERFFRNHHTLGKQSGGKMVLAFKVENYAPLKIFATQTHDRRWWVTKIETVLPSLLHGHNGRPIREIEKLWMALTITQFLVKMVVQPDGHPHIIPGIGSHNLGYIDYLECSTSIQDPGHLFLNGSHLARLKFQQRGTGIYLGESSHLSTRELGVSVYDKNKQLREGCLDPSGCEVTRVEVIAKDGIRLGKEVKATRLYAGEPGEVVATITPETSYALLRANVERMLGFGWCPDRQGLDGLCKNARLIAVGLGDRITDPRHLKLALAACRHSEGFSPNTFRRLECDLRAYAFRTVIRDPLAIVPEKLEDLCWVDVKWPMREQAWATLMRDIGAPTEPDPAIVAAWSQTTMRKKPEPGLLTGPIAPRPLPFLKSTL